MQLDAVDKKMLRALQDDCTLGAEALAERCGVSPSTALRRMKRLREEGVIGAEVAILDAKKVGRPLLFIVGVRLDDDDARVVSEFVRDMRQHPAVMQCYFVTGAADYILHVSAGDMEEFNQFVQICLIANPHVKMSSTNVVIDRVKVGLKLPIAD